MFRSKWVALLAAAAVSSSALSFSNVPANAQALRAGLSDLGPAHAAATGEVAWRGGPAFRGGRGGFRGARMGGPRFVAARPGWRPGPGAGWNRPGWNRPGVGWNRPGWNRPGWNRPGWGPGVGWGRPGWRPPAGAWGPGRWYPGWGWWRPGWGWGYYNNSGAWIALAAVSGLAIGAAAANAQPVYGGDAVAYCMQRFRSYNPSTGTYTGYDGYQHPCP